MFWDAILRELQLMCFTPFNGDTCKSHLYFVSFVNIAFVLATWLNVQFPFVMSQRVFTWSAHAVKTFSVPSIAASTCSYCSAEYISISINSILCGAHCKAVALLAKQTERARKWRATDGSLPVNQPELLQLWESRDQEIHCPVPCRYQHTSAVSRTLKEL